MRAHAARDYWEDWGLVLLVTSFLLGPATTALDLLIGYAAVKPACREGAVAGLRLLSFGALALTVFGAAIGYSCLTRLRGAVEDGGRIVDRSYFAAWVACGLNVLCALIIATAGFARFVFPCE